jgi:hypothetical protein
VFLSLKPIIKEGVNGKGSMIRSDTGEKFYTLI